MSLLSCFEGVFCGGNGGAERAAEAHRSAARIDAPAARMTLSRVLMRVWVLSGAIELVLLIVITLRMQNSEFASPAWTHLMATFGPTWAPKSLPHPAEGRFCRPGGSGAWRRPQGGPGGGRCNKMGRTVAAGNRPTVSACPGGTTARSLPIGGVTQQSGVRRRATGRCGRTRSNQDFRFGHRDTAIIAESRLRCNGLRTAFRLNPPIFAGPAFRSGLVKAFRPR